MSIRRARSLLVLAAALLTTSALEGQATGSIRGVVRLEGTGRPLDLAQVTVSGTQLGARTREDGTFLINGVPVGTHQVRVVRIGHSSAVRTVDVAAGQTVAIEVALRETPLALEEMVVTGTAEGQRKKELGNSMASISSEELQVAPVFNAQDVLSARATGVTVLANSGQPGAGGTIRLRGNNSISQGNNPVVYVDGIRVYSENGPIALQSRQGVWTANDIPADQIERVEIVRGAAATTLYGTEASGGVIQIFTKRGSAGKPQWDLEMGLGWNELGHYGPESDVTGLFIKQCTGENLKDTNGNVFVDPTCPASGSWAENGLVQRYNLGLRGGTDNFTYSLSANFNDEQGVIETGFSEGAGISGNFTFAPRSNLTFQWSSNYQKNQVRWIPDGNNAGGFTLNVNRGPFNNYKGGQEGECDGVTVTCVTNAYVLDEDNRNRRDHFITGLTMNWNTTPKITNRVSLGYDYINSDDQNIRPFGNLRTPLGFIWKVDWRHTKLTLDYAGSWRAGFKSDKIVSTLSWGAQYFRDQDFYTRVDGDDFSGPGDPTLRSAARTTVQASDRLTVTTGGFFLQETLGFNDRVFLTLGGRVDGNSSFGEDFGYQFYPKASVSWVMSEQGWWPKNAIETFKLRLAAGESGKAPGAFDALRTWTPVAGDEGKPAFTPAQLGNPDLGPERTRELEVGFDLSTLNGRLGFEFTGYRARTEDALIGVNYPPSEGFTAPQLENVGTVENQGVELSLNAGIIQSSKVDWNVRVNFSRLKSEAIDVGDVPIDVGNGAQVRNGYPVPGYWGRKIQNPDDFANPIVSDTAEYLGRVYPNQIWGLQTTLALFRRVTLDALGELQSGANLANWVGYQGGLRGIWQPCYATQAKLREAATNPSALDDVTALERGRCAIDRTVQNDRFWIEPSDFFKIRNVSLTYDATGLLGKTIGARNLAVTAAVRNLYTSTDYSGSDPEVKDSRDSGPTALGRRDYYNFPPLRTFFFSVRMGF
jgi:TonB-linked SusC/RagA family outer membrane protein